MVIYAPLGEGNSQNSIKIAYKYHFFGKLIPLEQILATPLVVIECINNFLTPHIFATMGAPENVYLQRVAFYKCYLFLLYSAL